MYIYWTKQLDNFFCDSEFHAYAIITLTFFKQLVKKILSDAYVQSSVTTRSVSTMTLYCKDTDAHTCI